MASSQRRPRLTRLEHNIIRVQTVLASISVLGAIVLGALRCGTEEAIAFLAGLYLFSLAFSCSQNGNFRSGPFSTLEDLARTIFRPRR